MQPRKHRRRVRQLLTLIVVLLALSTLTVRTYVSLEYGWDSGLAFDLIGYLGWAVVGVGLLSVVTSFGRDAIERMQARYAAEP
ncbi:hypothetical protein V5735_17280 (plasmid) [Haladaptatus sp. SPP-AMP-3]|uniref:hypothetical protein n=1 Tax=Haladaptatus sp. SPP-AMP-3 TaxID=3121295 RepID=UPI003C30651D